MAVQTKIQLRRDTAANWTSTNPTLAAGEIGYDTTNNKFKIGNGTNTWSQLIYQSDASLLSGTASITALTTSGNVTVGGNLTVNGTTTSLNSSTVQIDDKNIELASVAASTGVTVSGEAGDPVVSMTSTTGLIVGMSVTRVSGTLTLVGGATISSIDSATAITLSVAPGGSGPGSMVVDFGGATNTTADGAGITVKGATDKTLNWVNATAAWTSSEDFNLASGKVYEINGTTVLSSTQVLGYTPNASNSASTLVLRDADGDIEGRQFTSTIATGTAPFVVSSTTKVTNLNADTLDGYDTATAATANTVAVRDANGSLTANVLIGSSANVTGQLISTVATGTAPLSVASTTKVTNLNADTVDGYDTATAATANTVAVRNASAWLIANVFSGTTANVTGQLISTQATGTAPLSVSSTTVVSNLNADLLDGYNTATTATVNTVAVRDANGSLTANVFIGSSANVTGQLISTVTTGTAPLSVASTTRVANLNVASANTADYATNIIGAANVIFYNGTANTTSTLGYSTANNGQVLTVSSGALTWTTPASTGVTNVATGAGLTGGPITSTGTISLNTAYATTWTATQQINVSTDSLVFGIKANTTQTSNIMEARNGAGTMMMSLSNVGTLFAVTIDGGSA